ncbi:MAG: hypothetical protein AAGF12_07425 [Myxococcota bacterium]
MAGADILFVDVEQAAANRAADFAALVVRYSHQPDRWEGDANDPRRTPPADAWTVDRLRAAIHPDQLFGKDEDEKKALRRESWNALLASPWAPPRLGLAALLPKVYTENSPWSRAAILHIVKQARLRWGVWGAFKTIYKQAEASHDSEVFGALACRLDLTGAWNADVDRSEVTGKTTSYLRRRAWRYLRLLGQSVPELFPEMAVQVLRHYPKEAWLQGSWVANHIFARQDLLGYSHSYVGKLPAVEKRAFHEAWKLSPAPLLFLLEAAEHDRVCEFAIAGLEKDFAEELRAVDVAWLARVGKKALATTQRLVVKLLEANPEFHQSKLRDLGLHDTVLGFLATEDDTVAAYAVEYVKAHEPDLGIERMLALAEKTLRKSVADLIVARLTALAPERFGLPTLFRMLGIKLVYSLAEKKVRDGYAPKDIDEAQFVDAYVRGRQAFLTKFYESNKVTIPTSYLLALVAHPRLAANWKRRALQLLAERSGEEIGMAWFKTALFDPATASFAANWLRQGKLKGQSLDVAWVQDLTRRPTQRALALQILGNHDIVSPAAIGIDWLLGLLDRADPTLSDFGRRYLLSNFGPADFPGGVDGIWALTQPRDAGRKRRSDAVRRFAFDWLRMHHPELGPRLEESRSLGVKPKASLADYRFDRLRPLLSDPLKDAREFASAIAFEELVRWNDPSIPYRLAGSRHPEARKVGVEALLSIGGDGDRPLPEDWLRSDQVFAMAESATKVTRELGLTLIRQHYDRIGSAEKLAWLMESPEREVRLFAVRLLWEKHRPRSSSSDKKSSSSDKKSSSDKGSSGKKRFDSIDALRKFLRTVLFGLPPGRLERREGSGVDRPLKSGEAKRRLVGLCRDMGIADADFAEVVSPIFSELSHSEARGEWQSCVGALSRLRRAHPSLDTALPQGSIDAKAPRSNRVRGAL